MPTNHIEITFCELFKYVTISLQLNILTHYVVVTIKFNLNQLPSMHY